jgi:hypothetical protein
MAKFEVTINGKPIVVEAADENEAITKAQAPQQPQATRILERGTGVLGTIDAAIRGAADVATFGYMDEIAAGMNSLVGLGSYDENLAEQRAIDRFDQEHNSKSRIAGQVGGGVLQALALGPSLAGRGYLGNLALGAAEGAVTGGLYATGSAEGDALQRAKAIPEGAANGALWGGGAAAVMPVVGRVAREGADMLGFTPPRAQAPVSPGDEFGVSLRRGQLPGAPVSQAQLEQDILQGARGGWARDFLTDHEALQRQQLGTAAEGISRQLNNPPRPAAPPAQPGVPLLPGPTVPAPSPGTQVAPLATRNVNELGNITLENVRAAERASAGAVDQAYAGARAAGGSADLEAVARAPARVRQTLEGTGIIVNDDLAPYTARALQGLDEFGQLGGVLRNDAQFTLPQGNIAGVTLDGIEAQRRMIRQAVENASKPDDIRASRAMLRAYDSWLDEAAQDGLLRGDPDGLEMWKRARQLRREHGRNFEGAPTQRDNDAGNIIARMIDKEVTGNEVVNAIVGTSKAGANGTSVRIVRRLQNVLGADSPEFGQIRQLAWERMLTNSGDTAQAGPQAVAQEIRRTLEGKGSDYGRALFTREQRALMLRYANLLEATVPRARTANTSNSGGVAARAMQAAQSTQAMIMASLGGMLAGGGTGGSVAAGALGGTVGLAATGGTSLFNRLKASQATRPLPAPAGPMGLESLAPIRPGAAYGAAAADEDRPLQLRVRPRGVE